MILNVEQFICANILVIDDQNDICELIKDALEDISGINVFIANNKSQAWNIIKNESLNLVLLDIWLENQNDGIEILKELKKANYNFPVIMISGHGNVQIAVKSIKIGAYDYIEKPFPTDKLKIIVKNALNYQELESKSNENKFFSNEFLEILGSSKYANEMRDFSKKFAKSESRILIYGESGSGKEFFARYIHKNSNHKNKAFHIITSSNELVINNLNFDEENLTGTIFVDEITKFPLYFQKSLLNLINRVQFNLNNNANEGGNPFRIIVSSSQDLKDAVENNKFDADLYNRLNVLTIKLESTAKRLKDLPEFCNFFVNFFHKICGLKIKKFSEDAIFKLSSYDFGENFSQLKNIIECLLIMYKNHESEIITPGMLNPNLFSESKNSSSSIKLEDVIDLELKDAREFFEKKYILMQLKRFDGSITKTAEFIGMDRSALHRKLKFLEIEFSN